MTILVEEWNYQHAAQIMITSLTSPTADNLSCLNTLVSRHTVK